MRLRTGHPAPLASPEEALAYPYTPLERDLARASRRVYFAGNPTIVKKQLDDLMARTRTDELMITTMVHGHADRLRSYELLAKVFEL